MSVKSTIETGLDEEDRKALDQLIAAGRLSLNGLLEWLGEKGYDISRSALHRHVQKIDAMGAKLRQSRTMTEALVKELGPDITEGKQGRLLVEVLRSLVFDHLAAQMADDGEGGGTGLASNDFFFLAKAMKEMASANKIDLDRDQAIRADAEKKVKAEAAIAVDAVIKQAGLTKDTVASIKAAILGISADGAS